MALQSFSAANFRCLESVEAAFSPSANLIVGPNAAGKTSVLEAIGYLGRGKSFRGTEARRVIRQGCEELVVGGTVTHDERSIRLGVKNGPAGLETSVSGDRDGGAAALAEILPLQVIDPDVHSLVGGGPDERRRFLDWVGFHVEPGYLQAWRRYRKALRQRNACLKAGGRLAELEPWDAELVAAGESLGRLQSVAFARIADLVGAAAGRLLSHDVTASWRQGWGADEPLAAALAKSRDRDLQMGSSQVGPHRADIVLRYDERVARKLVSRGQQKLLASGLVLAGVAAVQDALGRPLLLLLDDPAAELDSNSLTRLMGEASALGSQVIATSLTRIDELFAAEPSVFHVEQGQLTGG